MNVTVISASAGTGKTTRLTRCYSDAVAAGTAPGAILATTFTRKAAAELVERVRSALITTAPEAAQAVLSSLIGTIDSVCGQLVADHALVLGLSPDLKVIGEQDQAPFFHAAVEAVLQDYDARLRPTAARMGIDDWREVVRKIVNEARPNGMDAAGLRRCAQTSWDSFLSLLPPAGTGNFDHDLRQALDDALAQLGPIGDRLSKGTAKLLPDLRAARQTLAGGGRLSWAQWAKLAKLSPPNDGKAATQPVCRAAARHPEHPQLHEDVRTFIQGVFDCAIEALDLYAEVKKREGLVDFVDQETLALGLLDNPEVREDLERRLRLALVDEFQDTNPLQLALFVRLAEIAAESIWVGDQKQAIYGFRGTDPALVQEVAEMVMSEGGGRDHLPACYRSRPEIVHFISDLFGAALPAAGIPAGDIRVNPIRKPDPALGPALHLWQLGGSNKESAAASLASGIRTLLEERWQTAPREGHRPIRGSDIAVLCNSNMRCGEVADALAAAGLKVALPRDGLLEQRESVLGLAALRYLVDERDTLALAQLIHLHPEGMADGSWLEPWLRDEARIVAARIAPVAALDAARGQLIGLTPAQVLDLALNAGRVAEAVLRWDDPRQRLANLDALRGLAERYQDQAGLRRSAATAAGFIAWLGAELDNGGAQPASPDPDAVVVMTFHKAKGLEWPVTIVNDLDAGYRDSPFGLHVGSETGIDPRRPLAGRWLRYWPWPYGQQEKGVHLDTAIIDRPETKAAAAREHGERSRLLYVAMTRARDYLILAVHKGTAWLDRLGDLQHRPILTLPKTDGAKQPVTIHDQRNPHSIDVTTQSPPEDTAPNSAAIADVYVAPSPPRLPPAYAPLRLTPSSVGELEVNATAVAATVTRIGDRLPLVGQPDMDLLGEAIHRFLAADRESFDRTRRLAMAEALLQRWGVTALSADHLLLASDRLRAFVAEHWPQAVWRREVPVQGRRGLQRVSGRIDLLLDTTEGAVLIDHKSFPGRAEQWSEKAAGFAPQLSLYAELVTAATGRPVLARYIHMPIVGALVELG